MRSLIIAAAQQQARVSGDIDLQIYLASLTTPLSDSQIALLTTFVTDIKTGLGITRLYDAFDQMLIHANETIESGLKNLVKRAHDATLHGTDGDPIFTALEGFSNIAQNRYIDTHYQARNEGVVYELNNASAGIYMRQHTLTNTWHMGANVSEGGNLLLSPAAGNGNISVYMNSSGHAAGVANPSTTGMFIATRPAIEVLDVYQNKNLLSSFNIGVTNTPDFNIFLLARNVSGTAQNFSRGQMSLSFVGRGLSQTDVNVITDTFQAYMTANGKQV